MKCPHCGKDKHTVLKTMQQDAQTWRYRLCSLCFKTFATLEEVAPKFPWPSQRQKREAAEARRAARAEQHKPADWKGWSR